VLGRYVGGERGTRGEGDTAEATPPRAQSEGRKNGAGTVSWLRWCHASIGCMCLGRLVWGRC
jgi:hypothetical protein